MNYKGENGYEVLYPLIYTNLIPLSEVINTLFEYPDGTKLDSALAQLFLGASNYGYVIQVNDYNGNPVEGATITGSGISKPGGGSLVTSASGQIVVTSTATSINVGVTSPYIDLLNAGSVQINSTGQLSYYTFTLADNVNVAQVHVTVKLQGGTPIQNQSMWGVSNRNKTGAKTDEEGICDGWSEIGDRIGVTTLGYRDVSDTFVEPTLIHGQINNVELVINRSEHNYITFSGSGTIKFSPEVKSFNCSAVGGGMNGSQGYNQFRGAAYGGAGGSGGQVANKANISYNGGDIVYQVSSSNSGISQITYNNTVQISAQAGMGASGGAGADGGNGTRARSGGNSNTFLYPQTAVGGGGGGGGAAGEDTEYGISAGGYGGSSGGGTGGKGDNNGGENGTAKGGNATSPGAGGGGGGAYQGSSGYSNLGNPGYGQSGLVGFVWNY